MVYSQLLKTPRIQKALEAAGVSHRPSPIDGNFLVPDPLEGHEPATVKSVHEKFILHVIDQEIISRRRIDAMEKEHKANEAERRRNWWKSPKADEIRPFIEQLAKGRTSRYFEEETVINYLTKKAADKYSWSSSDEESNDAGKTDLEKLLKAASVKLSRGNVPADVAQRVIREHHIFFNDPHPDIKE